MICGRQPAPSRTDLAGEHLDALQFGVREQIAGPRIVARRVNEDFLDGVRVVTKLGGDGVKTVDQA